MRFTAVLTLLLTFVILAQCSRALNSIAKRISPAGATGSHLEPPSPAKLCTLLGFRSKSGLYLHDAVFGGDAISKDTIVFKAQTPKELERICDIGDVAVAHVSNLERSTGAESLLESISAHVHGLCKSKRTSTSLIVLVDGKEAEGKELERNVNEIVAETEAFGCTLEVIYRYSGGENAFDVEQVDAIRDTLLSRAVESAGRRARPRSVADLQAMIQRVREGAALAPSKRPLSPERAEQKRKEFAATEAIKHLPREYQDQLSVVLNSAASSTIGAGKPANATVKALTSAVRKVTAQFCRDHTALLQGHLDTQAVRTHLPAQCREIATDLLLPVYREVVQGMRLDMMRRFEKQILRTKGSTPGFTDQLKILSTTNFETFNEQVQFVHDSFAKMVLSSESVVESRPPKAPPGSSNQAKSRELPRLPQFDATFEKYQLLLHMQQRCTEHIHAQSLAGAHNPYVRNYPFPPFHLNFNYLLDPKGLFANREFARMYDDPNFGPCENRADPLVFDGVAIMPFNPYDLPLKPDPRSNWQRTRDWWMGRYKDSVGSK